MKSYLLIATLALLLNDCPTAAQSASDVEKHCADLFDSIKNDIGMGGVTTPTTNVCRFLATIIYTQQQVASAPDLSKAIKPRDVQAFRDGAASASGIPGQGTAISSLEPVEQGGLSIAATGTKAGAGATMSIAMNPSIFWIGPESTLDIAKYSRLADVSFLVPVDHVDADSNGIIDYFGIRMRLNVHGLKSGSEAYENVLTAYDNLLRAQTEQIRHIETILSRLPKPACIRAMLSRNEGAVQSECGVSLLASDPTLEKQLQKSIEAARMQADKLYWGADIRADFGDLNLGGIDTVSGTAFYGGVAYGKRWINASTRTSGGLNCHLGVHYIAPTKRPDTAMDREPRATMEGALGFEFNKYIGAQRLSFNSGVEFHTNFNGSSSDDTKELPSSMLNYGVIRSSLHIPVVDGMGVSINLGLSLWGGVGTSLNINGNWRLLWPGGGSGSLP